MFGVMVNVKGNLSYNGMIVNRPNAHFDYLPLVTLLTNPIKLVHSLINYLDCQIICVIARIITQLFYITFKFH